MKNILGYSYHIWEFSHKAVHDYTAWITGCVVAVSDREMIREFVNFLRRRPVCVQGLCCKKGQIK